MNLRALIVEDEPLARRTLWDFLEPVDWLTCVGEAADVPKNGANPETGTQPRTNRQPF